MIFQRPLLRLILPLILPRVLKMINYKEYKVKYRNNLYSLLKDKYPKLFFRIMPFVSSFPIAEIFQERHLLNLLQDIGGKLCRNRTCIFIDCGAYEGLYTILASPFAKYVIALEPEPINYKRLRTNLDNLKIGNVIALNYAAFSYNG